MHELEKLVKLQKEGTARGICSICSSNIFVIDAAIVQAVRKNTSVLIEATANQVNQMGGYTGMKPADYRDLVYERPARYGLPQDRIILGGDHLGPVAWKKMDSDQAMNLADELVYEFSKAGYSKIHLDASMPLGDEVTLSTEEIADRTVRLCKIAEKGFAEYKAKHPEAISPVYIIGSEVPTPGGSGEEDELSVTKPQALTEMLECFQEKFSDAGLKDAWKRVIGAVVQPGVEFGNEGIHAYIPEEATMLMNTAKSLSSIVLEGHSTDYQSKESLRKMVCDGVAILKVGPALTFAAREGLFGLAFIEKELSFDEPSNFMEVLEDAMMKEPGNWNGHYPNEEPTAKLMRRFSLSDRCRYYMNVPEVEAAIDKMISNLKSRDIPCGLMSQFLPTQYKKIREGQLSNDPYDWVIDKVCETLDEYWYAAGLMEE